jgi:hypothetical protein
MVSILVLIIAAAATATLAFWPSLRRSSSWRATVTPLASIMGSGFLVCAPLLDDTVGRYAVPAMAGLLVTAYLVGGVIRYNIAHAEPLLGQTRAPGASGRREHHLHEAHRTASASATRRAIGMAEGASHLVLATAYFISVSYYLQLLAAFLLRAVGAPSSPIAARLIVSAILLGLGAAGVLVGLRGIERVERYVVAVNLGMIAALLAGLAVHNGRLILDGAWSLPGTGAPGTLVHRARVLMGLLIVVQGFETSRFLGAAHSRAERIATMRRAQWIAAAVYLAFLALATGVFSQSGQPASTDVTAIVRIAATVAPVLPVLVVIAAMGSQFSASVADDAGCAGLLEGALSRWMTPHAAYAVVSVVAIGLTWATNVLQIISLASRAFALFYALQSLVAVLAAWTRRTDDAPARTWVRIGGFLLVGAICLAVTIFGIPAG